MTPRKVGLQIGKIRKKSGIKQIALASQIGLSLNQLKNIERGRKDIEDDIFDSIAKALGVPRQKLTQGCETSQASRIAS